MTESDRISRHRDVECDLTLPYLNLYLYPTFTLPLPYLDLTFTLPYLYLTFTFTFTFTLPYLTFTLPLPYLYLTLPYLTLQ